MVNIKQVYVCIGSIVPLEEQEEIDIVKRAISMSRSHSNVFEEIFKTVFEQSIMIERSVVLLPFTDIEDLPSKTREMFFKNKPQFDSTKNPNFLMHFDIPKGGKEVTVAVLFLFE